MKKQILKEEINKIKLMMNLSESTNINLIETSLNDSEIDEQLGGTISKELGSATKFSKASREIQLAFKDMEAAISINSNPIKVGTKELKTADDIFTAIKDGSLLGKQNAKELGRVEKGLLKSSNTPYSLRKTIATHFAGDKNILKELSKNCKSTKDIKTYLNGKGYKPESIDAIISELKTKNLIDNKGVFSYVTKTTVKPTATSTTTGVGSTIKKYTTDQFEKLKQFFKGGKRSWKETLLWASGIGITGLALWWMLKDSGQTPEDMPPNPPTEGEWMPCIQKLINDKVGSVVTSDSGEISVLVMNSPKYPKGIKFYSPGSVMDVATGKKGSYKCKVGQTQQTNEQLDINELGNEISQKQMASYVDDAVDDLDGYVAVYNLNNLKSYLTALKGKTYKGKDAIQAFLELYKQDEGGDDFIKDVQSVGVRTLGVNGIEAKKEILNLLQSTSSTNQTSNDPLDDINITWDVAAGTGGGNTKPKKSFYFDCPGDEFPIKFGCRKSTKIKEIQTCFGFEQKYQTGNFGPITQKKLEDEYGKTFTSLDEGTYNDIINNKCGKSDIEIDPSTGRFKDNSVLKSKYDTKGKLKNIIDKNNPTNTTNDNNVTETSGEELYNQLLNTGNFDSGKIGDNRVKYKGTDLSNSDLTKLNDYIKSKGYRFIKSKDKGAQYSGGENDKYVWSK